MDRQLKEQFIHGLNDKIMLDEIITELTSRTSNVQMTSKDVPAMGQKSQGTKGTGSGVE